VKITHVFRDPTLRERALTHPSAASERRVGSYESLEFLGDSVLQLLVTDLLLRARPTWDQGLLSKARQKLVNQAALAELAADLELGGDVRLGRGEAIDRERRGDKPRILADAFEAELGALYLDGGLDVVVAEVGPLLALRVGALDEADLLDPKSRLQQLVQREGGAPAYGEPVRSGPDNALWFAVTVTVRGTTYGPGEGGSHREAEQAAARIALSALVGAV
jgi:ribonuclease III